MQTGYAAVIGAVNIDIWGKSFAPLIDRDSNPGEVRFSFGGVGRNIAHNMSLLGTRVRMLTAIGDDLWSGKISENCCEIGIDLSHALFIPGGRTSAYLCISGPDGDLALGICDADIAAKITPAVIERELDFLNGASLVVIDGNLSEETLKYICENVTAPLFADPVSVTKAMKLKPFLKHIHTLKPNELEAELLTGYADPEKAAKELVRLGVGRAFVSCGADGMVVAEGDSLLRVGCCTARLVNATGGGDASMAALCNSYIKGCDTLTSARRAMVAGAIAVESAETISPLMSAEAVDTRLMQENI